MSKDRNKKRGNDKTKASRTAKEKKQVKRDKKEKKKGGLIINTD